LRYAQKAYQYAKNNNLTSQQVEKATNKQIANACGVNIEDVKGNPDFLAWNIKKQVVRKLKEDEQNTANESRSSKILAKVKELAEEANATARFVKKGETVQGPCIVIERDN
jgi:hypothetical protein